MKHPDTTFALKRNDPFLESKDELKAMKGKGNVQSAKDRREGQSEYRKDLATRKQKS